MQERHQNHDIYFQESATSCRSYYIPYITENTNLKPDKNCRVLEIGCGLGGNLSVFANMGCSVTGIDIDKSAIKEAEIFFNKRTLNGTFIFSDIFEYECSMPFDLILLHDSIEHIPNKDRLLLQLKTLLKDDGVLFICFPAWQMPFGGHQQMAKNKFIAHFPYIHLLPKPVFRFTLKTFGESDSTIDSFLEIKDTRITIEDFSRLIDETGYSVINRQLYFINPHYHVKFGLKPRKLSPLIGKVPYLRNFFTTSCFYLLRSCSERKSQ